MTARSKAALSLALLVPAASVGTYLGMVALPDTTAGRLCFAFSKVWLFGLPLLWLLWVERARPSHSPARKGGWAVGILSGVAISTLIVGLYAAFGARVLDRAFFVSELRKVGLAVPWRYAAAATYWILVNAVLEEYVWRWFCVRQCARLWRPPVAVFASALFFTLHHIVATSVYFPPPAVVLCSTGAFLGGLIWSAMYLRYESVWPGYVSHALVDVAIFSIGAIMLFGG